MKYVHCSIIFAGRESMPCKIETFCYIGDFSAIAIRACAKNGKNCVRYWIYRQMQKWQLV